MSLYESLVHYYCKKSCYEHFYQSFCVHILYSSWCSKISFKKKKVSHINKPVKSHSIDRWIDLYIYIYI